MDTILEIKNLEMAYETNEGYVSAVDNVSFKIMQGETMGLVGESGCGKTSLGMCIMKLLPDNARITDGQIIFNGEDIVSKTEDEMRGIRWKGVSMIFQAAMNALNPVYKVGDGELEQDHHEPVRPQEEPDLPVRDTDEVFGVDGQRPPVLREDVVEEHPHAQQQDEGPVRKRLAQAPFAPLAGPALPPRRQRLPDGDGQG